MSIIPLARTLPLGGAAVASATLGSAHSFGAVNTSASTTLMATTTTASGTGDLLVAAIKVRDTTVLASVTGITDSAGTNTWSKAAGKTQGTQADEEIWYAASAASVTTITVTVSGASALAFTVVDLAGASSAPLDVTATAGGVSTTASSGTTAGISQSSEIVVAGVGWNGTVTPSAPTAGYTPSTVEQSTASGSATGEQAAWDLLSPSGAQTYGATLSSSTTWTGAIAAFKVSTGPPPAPTISSFSPTSGPVGTPVVINGTGFTGASAVAFNGTNQPTFTVNSDIKISTSVPSGATGTGPITVTAAGTATSPTNFAVTVAPSAPHIMVIVEENHSYSGTGGIIGNSMTPYINTLAQTYLSATNWYGVTHGSPSDYKALLAGTTAGSITSPFPNTTLVDELASAGISWKAYMESMPSDCATSNYPPGSNSSTALYASDHNPFLYYASTRTVSACQENVPYSQFATDLSMNALPDFMFVVPNQCNDMHSECPAGGNNEPGNGDTWLKNNLPAVMASTWYQQGGIVIITWDEAYHTDSSGWVNGVVCPSSSNCGGGQVPTIIVSATNKALSNHSFTTGGNLYGILRGIEEKYGVGLLANTAKAGNGDLIGALG